MTDTDSPHLQTAALHEQLSRGLRDGQEMPLPPISLPHYPIADTAAAACFGTLGIPFRNPAPYTHDVALDALGNECSNLTCWWLADGSPAGYETVKMVKAWSTRPEFEAAYPIHPLNHMRAAIDARDWWVRIIHHREVFPAECRETCFVTDSIHAASVLKACGYTPRAFTGRAFALSHIKDRVPAQQVLDLAAKADGQTPPQWMSRALINYGRLLKTAKEQSILLAHAIEDKTVILTADSTPKTRDRFFGLVRQF